VPRLFVAAWPDDDLRRELTRLPRPDEDGVRWVPPSNWHVTLRFLGDAEIEPVRARLAEVPLPRARLRLGPTVDRLGEQALVVSVRGADELASAVLAATQDIGPRSERTFRGHLTLARTRRGASPTLLGAEFDGELDVREVAVVESELSADGPVYRTLATIRTGGATTHRS
jgi:2'-5' RNA ligase